MQARIGLDTLGRRKRPSSVNSCKLAGGVCGWAYINRFMVSVVQLARTSDCGSEGQRFKPAHSHHTEEYSSG